jgi:uncharacterized membrane protein YdjX (TVP38/TMEM64 family)
MNRRIAERQESVGRLLALVSVTTLVCLLVWHLREPLSAFYSSRSALQEQVSASGAWAPWVVVGLSAAQVVLAPIPGQTVGIVSGYLFGVFRGALYTMFGLSLGTTLAIWIGRRLGRPVVALFVDQELLSRWDGIVSRRGEFFLLLVFLVPFLPDDLACLLVGLSTLPIKRMVVLSAVGRLPGVLVSCWVGTYASAIPTWAWIPIAGVVTVLALIFWRNQQRMEDTMIGLIDRVSGIVASRRGSTRRDHDTSPQERQVD